MKYDHQIIVIGGGSADLVVAAGAASLGADVALVEREKMGGECLNSGYVPSKTFLRCAHQAAEIRDSARVDYSAVPWVTYTRPEVAHAGYTEEAAKEKRLLGDSLLCDLAENDRARTEGDAPGFIKIVMDRKGRIIGTTIVGRKAGEMIALSVMAIGRKLKATCFMNVVMPYPTESEIYGLASRNIAKKSLKPWMKKVIRRMI